MSEYASRKFGTSLRIALHDKENGTYRGSILLKNWTAWYDPDGGFGDTTDLLTPNNSTKTELFDPLGASYYVIAVILVYGMSIVALIASHIKRKKAKLVEDRQINKYLREFQTVQEESSRETYKNLKRRIKEQINWDKQTKSQTTLHHNLSQALLPMLAVGVSLPRQQRTSSLSSASFKGSKSSLGAVHSRAGSLGQINIGQPRSRTSSVGSNNGVSVTLSVPSGEASPVKHDRKRGLANLFTNSNSDYPLEKILEESLDSRSGSFKRKSSKKSLLSTVGSAASNDLKTLSADLSDSRYDQMKPSDTQSVQDNFHPSPVHSNSPKGDHFKSGPAKVHHLAVPSSHTDTVEDMDGKSDDTSSATTPLSDSSVSGRPMLTLAVPSLQYQHGEQIWIPCTEDISLPTSSYNNKCFRHSPSPAKSRGSSPMCSRSDATHESSSNDSDSETEQLLHITCV